MNIVWNPKLYNEKHEFVYKFGEEVVGLLQPRHDENILDLGCGTGELTKTISESCNRVIGIDNSEQMINVAREKYKDLTFYHQDARELDLDHLFDAVFSNSVLHWIPEQEMVIRNIHGLLKPGGRFVAEFGGKGCVYKIIRAITETLESSNVRYPPLERTLFYPSISEYSKLLEENGFELCLAMLFDRPTKLEEGEEGLKLFIKMFFDWLFENVPEQKKEEVYLPLIEDKLRDEHFVDSSWVADYRRIRVVAVKIA